MISTHDTPDFVLTKEKPQNAKFDFINVAESKWVPEHFIARITYNIGKVQVRRDYRLYDNVPAIAVDTYLKGEWDATLEERPILDQISITRLSHLDVVEDHTKT